MISLRGNHGSDYLVPWIVRSSSRQDGAVELLVYEPRPGNDASTAAVSVHKSLLDTCVADLSAKYRGTVSRAANAADASRVRHDTLAEVRQAIMSSTLTFANVWPLIATGLSSDYEGPEHVRTMANEHVQAMTAFLVTRDVAHARDADAGVHDSTDPFDVDVTINMTHLNTHSNAVYTQMKRKLFTEAAEALVCGEGKVCVDASTKDADASGKGELGGLRALLGNLHLYANVSATRIGHERLVATDYGALDTHDDQVFFDDTHKELVESTGATMTAEGAYTALLDNGRPEWVVSTTTGKVTSVDEHTVGTSPKSAPLTRDVCAHVRNLARHKRAKNVEIPTWAQELHVHDEGEPPRQCLAVFDSKTPITGAACKPVDDCTVPTACAMLVLPAMSATSPSAALGKMTKFIENAAPFARALEHQRHFVDDVRTWTTRRPVAPEFRSADGISLLASVRQVVAADYQHVRLPKAKAPPIAAVDDEYYMLTPDAAAGDHDGVVDFDSLTNFSAGQSPTTRIDAFNAAQVFLRGLVLTMCS